MKINFYISLCLIYFTSFVISTNDSSSPGIRLSLSQSGLSELEAEFLPVIFEGHKFNLSDIILKQHIDFLGNVKLNITDTVLTIDGITSDNLEILFTEPSSINLNLKNVNGSINFNYTINSGFYDMNSAGKVNISNIVVKIQSDLLSQPNFYEPSKLSPKINISDFSVDIGNVEISFLINGKLEEMIKFLIDNLHDAFINLIKEKFGNSIQEINNKINNVLAIVPLHVDLPGTNLTINYGLAEAPIVSKENLEISLNSSITSKNSNQTYEGPSYPIPHMANTNATLSAFLNQFLFDSLLFTAYNENLIHFYLNSDKISMFTTFTFGLAIPELYEYYKTSKPVDINLTAVQIPVINFEENFTLVDIDFSTDFIVRVNDTYKENAFTADMGIKLNLTADMVRGKANAKVYEINIEKFKVTNSNIGNIDDKDLNKKLNGIIAGFLQVFNNLITESISKLKIPSYMGVSFNQTDISTHDGYIEVGLTPHLENGNVTKVLEIIEKIKSNTGTFVRNSDNLKFLGFE